MSSTVQKFSIETLYDNIVEQSGIAVFLLDREGNRLFVNDAAVRITGHSRQELLEGSFGDFLSPEIKEKTIRIFRKCVETGEPVVGYPVKWTVDGVERSSSGSWLPIRDDSGRVYGVQVTVIDITDLICAQETAQHSQELYRTLIDAVGGPVLRVDRRGKRTFVSDYTVEMSGRSKDDWLRGQFGDTMVPEDRERAWKVLRETFRTGRPVNAFVTRQIFKGELRYMSSNWVPIRNARGDIVEVQVSSNDVTDMERMREQLQLYNRRMRKAQEEERLSISRFLHDDTIQTLTVVSNSIGAVLTREPLSSESAVELERIDTALRDQAEALRRLSMTLRPLILDRMGLDAAIKWFVRETCDPHGIAGDVVIEGTWQRLSPSTEVRLFRIVQEAVNNAVRHGHPSRVEVRLGVRQGQLALTIRDDGSGFDVLRSQIDLLQDGQLGLVGMKERAKAMGAEMKIESSPQTGTTISLRVPVDKLEDAI